MKDSEVLTQLAEARELLTMLEHLASSYGKQQQGRSEDGTGGTVAWQGLRFNLRECRKRVVAAHKLIDLQDTDARREQSIVSEVTRPQEAASQINRSALIPRAVDSPIEEQNSVEVVESKAEPELSPLAKRIRRAPTSASRRSSANDASETLRASGADARTERAGSLRELRPLPSAEKEFDTTGVAQQNKRMAE